MAPLGPSKIGDGETIERGRINISVRYLQARDGGGRILEDAAAPLCRFSLELGQRHDSVYQPHVEGLLGVVKAAQKPHLLGAFRADEG